MAQHLLDDICLAAIRGQKIPPDGTEFPSDGTDVIVNLCLLRGIRYHHNFAVTHFEHRGASVRRALNARSIMSNSIPNINHEDDFPYCIWHPEVALERTYAELADRYPRMRYQAGRACAVAHYISLFRQLKLLPDISIADEARDSGCDVIFQDIMEQKAIFAIMDDYTRCVREYEPIHERSFKKAQHLNSDTAVRSSLDLRRDYRSAKRQNQWRPSNPYIPFSDVVFNITEDYNIDEFSSVNGEKFMTDLLYTPLPSDLPPGNKQLLILSAAYYGDIDRYVRLRRPEAIPREHGCVIRGIYHNSMFAKYWTTQQQRAGFSQWQWQEVRRAVNARYIMNNDLSRVHADDVLDSEMPFMIWYPDYPHPDTLVKLAKINPFMEVQAARACIIAGYKEAYNTMTPIPDDTLDMQAHSQRDQFYIQDLMKRRNELLAEGKESWHPDLETIYGEGRLAVVEKPFREFFFALERQTLAPERASPELVKPLFNWIYDGIGVDISALELFVCAARPPQTI